MNTPTLIFSTLLPILLLLLFSLPLHAVKNNKITYNGIVISLGIALISGLGTGVWVYLNGSVEADIFNTALGLTVRLDALSILIYTMITIIALVVIKFSKNYLDGEPRQIQFFSRMAFTISLVLLFAISGHLILLVLTWIGTSLGLQRLLSFHSERRKAQLAAKKKFIIARIGDITLLSAFSLIYIEFGTGNLTQIVEALGKFETNTLPTSLEVAGILIALSAALKSVQIPTHIWILDVMESPTPVSALLHAGLLNAGPYLIIRFAHFIDLTSFATIVLVTLGAASALYGALAATTQSSVKNSLAYSSIGHMGFTLMVCGLGLYAAALLHLVAHSFYKAHAFLSSGSVIESIQLKTARSETYTNRFRSILTGLFIAIPIFVLSSYYWQIDLHTEFQLLLIAGIIFLGVASLQIYSWSQKLNWVASLKLILLTAIVVNTFYLLETIFAHHLANQIPELRVPGATLKIIGGTILSLFTITVIVRSWWYSTKQPLFIKKLEIHFRNGLYFHQFMNRIMNSLQVKTHKS